MDGQAPRTSVPGSGRRRILRKAVRLAACLGFLGTLRVLVLSFPEPFFPFSLQEGAIRIYSDRPLPRETVRLLRAAEDRLGDAGLLPRRDVDKVFLCNSPGRFLIFAGPGRALAGIGGVAYAFFPEPNVFLRAARIERNRLLSPSGREVPGERTLTFYVAHELAHVRLAGRLGLFRILGLPARAREAYCDAVGLGRSEIMIPEKYK